MSGAPVGLLDAIVRDALDPSYAEAHERSRKSAIARKPGTRRTLRKPAAAGAGVAILLAVGAFTGLAVASVHRTVPAVGAARSALAGDADARARQVQALEHTAATSQREVTALALKQAAANDAGRALARLTDALAAAVGQSPVRGQGVTVTVTDASADAGLVTDRQLQSVVNALWAAGARAIAVGDVRLGPQTAIRTAGDTILANFKPLRSPYRIAAIGGSTLPTAAGRSAALAALGKGPAGTHPTVAITAEHELRLPAASSAQPGIARPLSSGSHS